MQQVQPAFIMAVMQSQQAWIISQHRSPLVQVMQTPSLVISHLHMPMVRLQQQTIMPFIIMQQTAHAAGHHGAEVLHHAAGHRVVAEQVIFMPPVHFSIFMVQRGTIIMFMDGVMPPGIAVAGIP